MTPTDDSNPLPSRRELRARRSQTDGDPEDVTGELPEEITDTGSFPSRRSRRAAETPLDAPSESPHDELSASGLHAFSLFPQADPEPTPEPDPPAQQTAQPESTYQAQSDPAPQQPVAPSAEQSLTDHRPVTEPPVQQQPVSQSGEDQQTVSAERLRRRRRADSEPTATGSFPIITDVPQSRREARRISESQIDLQAVDPEPKSQPQPPAESADSVDEGPAIEFQSRRADAPATSSSYDAADISDTGVLNGLELEEKELQEDAKNLAAKIATMGKSNPNRIDPHLLQQQKDLAERAEELAQRRANEQFSEAEMTNTNIRPVKKRSDQTEAPTEAVSVVGPEGFGGEDPLAPAEGSEDPESAGAAHGEDPSTVDQPEEVVPAETENSGGSKLREAVIRARAPRLGQDIPRQMPIGAVSAHGLDPLNTKESASRERTFFRMSTIVLIVGVIALIIGIVMMIL